jgi:hypothetical protein
MLVKNTDWCVCDPCVHLMEVVVRSVHALVCVTRACWDSCLHFICAGKKSRLYLDTTFIHSVYFDQFVTCGSVFYIGTSAIVVATAEKERCLRSEYATLSLFVDAVTCTRKQCATQWSCRNLKYLILRHFTAFCLLLSPTIFLCLHPHLMGQVLTSRMRFTPQNQEVQFRPTVNTLMGHAPHA